MQSQKDQPVLAERWLVLRTSHHNVIRIGTVVLVLASASIVLGLTQDVDPTDWPRLLDHTVVRLRSQYLTVVLVLAFLHYAASAVSARAASGVSSPPVELLQVQLAAAAANRVTPTGLGGSAVLIRYFSRRGLAVPAALGAVALISIAGAVGDLLVLTFLVVAGPLIGLSGGVHGLQLLTDRLVRLPSPGLAGVILVAAAAAWVVVRKRPSLLRQVDWSTFWQPCRQLRRRPLAAFSLILAASSTTVILGFAFVASTAMIPGTRPSVAVGAILVAFMLGSAAGTAVPVPAGLGSTEAALTAVLVVLGFPAQEAVQQVIVFRLLTFWLPAVGGVLALWLLRRRSVL